MARGILLSEIVNNSLLSFRERVELFFDVYWNTYMREKTAEYIDERIAELDRLVSDSDNCKLGVKNLWSFKDMKFKDRDELVDHFRSWKANVAFNLDVWDFSLLGIQRQKVETSLQRTLRFQKQSDRP